MTTHVSEPGGKGAAHSSGWLVFAAVIMLFSGIMTLLGGISAIAKDDVFLATRNYVYELNLTGWGWIHLILGIVIALTGVALFTGATWARVVGVVLAGLSMIANFLWLPYTPGWALLFIALDAVIIWALCVSPRPVRD
ncbi:hypothetical protein M5362_12565 [Streptomyces sp. Je 1-79]|uniref:DUF7144 family membrane protein n=1 Tax=Streptomyces sp. Je 1-79 TaxID=2943847 RepID=UPI0021A638AD|nr:hypothetical protein [Streptomyces sp. Je 1-79]MCT4353962.1 hypothetical protein [Streptomyces sp. Je 1-79]